MELRIFQIDAFATKVFRGNPAAVCPLEKWLEEDVLQAIAQENNLAETAFFVPSNGGFHLRWFTPRLEVDLCGHATLASAFVIFTELEPQREAAEFASRSGPLYVRRNGDMLTMDFPTWPLRPLEQPPVALLEGLGRAPRELYSVTKGSNYFAVYNSQAEVVSLRPDFAKLEQLHPNGVIVTAPGDNSDCASRYFAPSYGIPEDPATGSIHSALTPFWAKRLNKKSIHARQVSQRGAELFCEDKGDRVLISGQAIKYLEGKIYI
ncbi:MAG TPA: PhzF family phenazine biosynthesis protein [Pyrinomonadaceae bacterium]|nr:PhzF family phenazine biosynthesis protein [Pyrinomonadaceae bacterium]